MLMYLVVHLPSGGEYSIIEIPFSKDFQPQIAPQFARVYQSVVTHGQGKALTWPIAFGDRDVESVVASATKVEVQAEGEKVVTFPDWKSWKEHSGERRLNLKQLPDWIIEAAKVTAEKNSMFLYDFVALSIIREIRRREPPMLKAGMRAEDSEAGA